MSKSDSTSRRVKYRLRRTLRRKVRYENFQEDDIKYIYGSHVMDGGEPIDPLVFHENSLNFINTTYDYIWTLKAKNQGKFIPVGFICGIECHNFIHIVEVTWLSWATTRNKLESSLKFLSVIRHKHLLTVDVPNSQKRFLDQLCRYGMLHRAGTLIGISDESSPFYQTKG